VRPVLILFVKAGVAVFQADFFAGHPHALDARTDVENVAVGDEEGGFLAGFERAKAVGEEGKGAGNDVDIGGSLFLSAS
jgi:hypothetical protein